MLAGMHSTMLLKKSHQRLPQAVSRSGDIASIRRRLLRWYGLRRRDLPWRKTSDPYRIWISEVMLQQTRVQAVVPYYEEFLRRFPDVKRLARASERELLACWSGLGYYSRARNLQQAAQRIVAEHGGRFPGAIEAALELPGVGVYTASAVLSIAHGHPLPVVDGNVARVLARLYTVNADLKTAKGKRELLQLAAGLLSRRRPGDFNQAMMELGATICLPLQPDCAHCPIQSHCRAYRRKEVSRYPRLRRKSKPVLRRFVAALAQDKAGRVLLVQRPSNDKWLGGFWELPMWESPEGAPLPGLALEKRLGTVRHCITKNRLEVAVYGARFRERRHSAKWRWLPVDDFGNFPVSTIARKALALLRLP